MFERMLHQSQSSPFLNWIVERHSDRKIADNWKLLYNGPIVGPPLIGN